MLKSLCSSKVIFGCGKASHISMVRRTYCGPDLGIQMLTDGNWHIRHQSPELPLIHWYIFKYLQIKRTKSTKERRSHLQIKMCTFKIKLLLEISEILSNCFLTPKVLKLCWFASITTPPCLFLSSIHKTLGVPRRSRRIYRLNIQDISYISDSQTVHYSGKREGMCTCHNSTLLRWSSAQGAWDTTVQSRPLQNWNRCWSCIPLHPSEYTNSVFQPVVFFGSMVMLGNQLSVTAISSWFLVDLVPPGIFFWVHSVVPTGHCTV